MVKLLAKRQLHRCAFAPVTTRALSTQSQRAEHEENVTHPKTTHFGFESVKEDDKVGRGDCYDRYWFVCFVRRISRRAGLHADPIESACQ